MICCKKVIMEHSYEKRFPLTSKDYKLYEEVGEGVSATVYRALCVPLNEIVAIKVLDLEKCNNDFDGIRREVQTMTLIDHPNVLRAHCSFTADSSLWVVMPYMSGGSCLHIIKSSHPEGFEETVIAILLREVLRALVYLHSQGHIHRDVKAGNILVDSNGAVKLADFGVSACMFDTGDRQRSRNTFVGTPCWMAPEVMQQLHGYDFKADIWSFGITALELAHGHAPFSKYPPMKVLLMTLQNAPPGLDYERDRRFSKSFKEMVAACLVKDPKKRPSSEKLLKHNFFKNPRSTEYLTKTILNGLPPLGDRFRMLKVKEADFLVQNKAMYGDKEHLSQQEYIRGISAWNFNLEDLKSQAELIQDFDGVSYKENPSASCEQKDEYDGGFSQERQFPKRDNHSYAASEEEDELNELPNDVEDSLASFPTLPLQALKEYFDVDEDDAIASGSTERDSTQPDIVQRSVSQLSPGAVGAVEQESRKKYGENLERIGSLPNLVNTGRQKILSGSVLPEIALSPHKKANGNVDREYMQPKYTSDWNYSGPSYRQKRENNNNTSEDTPEGAFVQHKGRFKVTSADLSPKAAANSMASQFSSGSSSPTVAAASILPSLQFMLQQNNSQKEQILKLIQFLEQTSGTAELTDASSSDPLQGSLASSREKELQNQVIQLQQSIGSSVEELQRLKMRNAQLQRQVSALSDKDEERMRNEKQL